MVLVSPRTCPETTLTAPNSPIARALQRMTPYSNAHLMSGRVTRRNICHPEDPSTFAASSCSWPCACISGISSRATNGTVTKTVARTMPGSAKMMRMSCSRSHSPNQPCRPKTSTKINPAMTGDTENGTSISVSSTSLPRKSNFAIAQAAATPKTRFSGTAMAAAVSVRRIAERASGSVIAARYTSMPLANASTNTTASGMNRKTVRNSRPAPIKVARISFRCGAASTPAAG